MLDYGEFPCVPLEAEFTKRDGRECLTNIISYLVEIKIKISREIMEIYSLLLVSD